MDIKGKIFNTLVGKLSVIFLVSYTIFYSTGEIIFAVGIGGNTFYFSIFFILLVLSSSVIMYLLLRKLEEKFFLYILFTLPVFVFCFIRAFDIFVTPLDYLSEMLFMIVSALLAIAFLVTAFFTAERRVLVAAEKKREKIVKSVLESQDKYREALDRKKEDWTKVIEEE